MRHHRALRLAGGARGVLQLDEVGRPRRPRPPPVAGWPQRGSMARRGCRAAPPRISVPRSTRRPAASAPPAAGPAGRRPPRRRIAAGCSPAPSRSARNWPAHAPARPGRSRARAAEAVRVLAEGDDAVARRQAAVEQHPGDPVGGQVELGEAPEPVARNAAPAGRRNRAPARRTASPMVLRRARAPMVGHPALPAFRQSIRRGGRRKSPRRGDLHAAGHPAGNRAARRRADLDRAGRLGLGAAWLEGAGCGQRLPGSVARRGWWSAACRACRDAPWRPADPRG